MVAKTVFLAILLTIVALLCWAWRSSFSARDAELPIWRRRLLFLGLFANSASFVAFLAIEFGARILTNWSPDIQNYRWVAFVLVIAITSGGFGRGTSRILTIASALVLLFMWMDLAASSL